MAWGANDTLEAGTGGAAVYANGADDVLIGSASSDTLSGYGASNSLVSGNGNEILVVNSTDTVVNVAAGQLNDTVESSVDFKVPANVSVMQMTGSGNRFALGGTTAATIVANSGQDTLMAGSQADTLVGSSAGSDLFIINSANDALVGGIGGATDTVQSSISYALPTGIDNLVLATAGTIGTANDDAHGALFSNQDSDTLVGGAGADTITGVGWNDVLISGSGIDHLARGHGSTTQVTFVINNSADVIDALSCIDTIESSANYVLTCPTSGSGVALQWVLIGSGNLLAQAANGYNDFYITANSGHDTLIGSSAVTSVNTLVAGTATDVLIGGGAGTTNTFVVHNSGDTVIASADATSNAVDAMVSMTMPSNVYSITATASNLVLTGNSGNDYMSSNDSGNDELVAGVGNDVLSVYYGDTIVFGSLFGNDDVQFSSGWSSSAPVLVQFSANPGDMTVAAISDRDGNPALQVADGSSAITLEGGLGTGNYQFKFAGGSTLTLAQFLEQANVVSSTVSGGSGEVILTGAPATSLWGSAGADTLLAVGAADTVNGGAGAQWLEALGTNESVVGGSASDTLEGLGVNDTLVAGASADTLIGGTSASVLFVINSTSDRIQLQSSPGADTISSSVNETLPSGINTLVLTGSLALKGNANNGADTLTSNSGVDTLVGGTGSDLFVLNDALDIVTVGSSHGADTIQSSFNDTLAANVATLVLTGSGAVSGTGNAIADVLRANAGNDTLVAGSGVATMVGGAGNDLFVVNNTADTIQSASTTSADTISSSVSFTLPANVNTLVLTGAGTLTGKGNTGDDLMTANITTGTVTLTAGAGMDTLVAGAGADTLVSGTGVDSLVGGSGSDMFVLNNSADVVTVGATHGTDTLQAAFNDTLAANVSVLVLTGSAALSGTGNAISDVLRANTGADTLTAGSGTATLVGGAGNDLFVVNNIADTVQSASTTAVDTISSSVSFTLPVNVNTLVLTGAGALKGTGNSAGADLLTAAAASGADTLVAGNGADTLVSGTGIDSLVGGTGSDLFVLNNSADVVTVGTTHGTDTLQAAFNDTLAANVSVLVLAGGSAALTGTGNAIADVLHANSGSDTLTAGSGVATLIGGTGNDVFVVNNTADTVQSASSTAVDTIQSSVSFTLPTNVNTLVLTGSGSLKGTGNTANDLLSASGTTTADTLVAGNGADTLISGTGADSLVGGTGADLFVVNATTDVVNVGATHGVDTIQSSVSYTLPANVQYLSLTGSTALTGTASNSSVSLVQGGTGADTLNGGTLLAVLEAGTAGAQVLKATGAQAALIGGGAADTLTGGAFKDFLAAGKVADTITGGATHNVVAVNSGDGATVLAPTTGAGNVLSLGAGIDTEALTFTKSGNNLVLNDGVAGDSITFTNWYLAAADQTTTTLQVIEAASASYSSAGTDPLRNKPIEEFNFTSLVAAFTAAGSTAGWALSHSMGVDTLASSATAAYGGDLAYYFGKNGNVSGMNLSAAQTTLTNASYATALQTIDSWSSISGTGTTLNVVVASPLSGSGADPTLATGTGRKSIQPVTIGNSSDSGQTLAPTSVRSPTFVTPDMFARVGTVDRALWPDGARGHENVSNAWASMHAQLDAATVTSTASVGVEAPQHGDVLDFSALMASEGVGSRFGRHDSTSQIRRLPA